MHNWLSHFRKVAPQCRREEEWNGSCSNEFFRHGSKFSRGIQTIKSVQLQLNRTTFFCPRIGHFSLFLRIWWNEISLILPLPVGPRLINTYECLQQSLTLLFTASANVPFVYVIPVDVVLPDAAGKNLLICVPFLVPSGWPSVNYNQIFYWKTKCAFRRRFVYLRAANIHLLVTFYADWNSPTAIFRLLWAASTFSPQYISFLELTRKLNA